MTTDRLWVGHGPPKRATLFDLTGGGDNIDLGANSDWESRAYSINNSGKIVGRERSHATLFDQTGEGSNIDLGTLGGWYSTARSINDLGQIVGWADDRSGDQHATLFDPTGGGDNIALGLGSAHCINDIGQIVGASYIHAARINHAILFDPTGGKDNIDLNTLIDPSCGWTLGVANSINNNGWIVGRGINPDGETHAFLLIPEPATLLLLGLGAMMVRKER